MMHFLRTAGLALALAVAASSPAAAQQTTPATAAIVKDMTSNAVLLEKNADEPVPPASMSKLMTLYMIFEALESGRMSLDDTFRTSGHAASMGGSKMFIAQGEEVRLEDLIRGVVVQSGNDAAVALAEALSGTEPAFADLMNKRAAEIGLTNSHFTNATGWPDEEHRMSVRDLATLSELIIREYPEMYAYFVEEEMTWADIRQANRNPLLGVVEGADGLKTGHTEEAGYGLAASAERDGRRVIVVVTGLESAGQRSQESERLINWAFRAFDTRTLFKAGEPLTDARVWLGAAQSVPVAPARDVIVTAPYGQLDQAKVAYVYDGPAEAPIEPGEQIGHIEIRLPDLPVTRVPAVATEAVGEGGLVARMRGAGRILFDEAYAASGLKNAVGSIRSGILGDDEAPAEPAAEGAASGG
ncbi:MAG TPA: D-alanyl-D-alanine carboxypeptidase family protein [Thermohalobaculum sp.]|nr:D-alanyl-D-alanine carboxypeptidase family protein [Thermohalobaculum sp.]